MEKIYTKILEILKDLQTRYGYQKINLKLYRNCNDSLYALLKHKNQVEKLELSEDATKDEVNKILFDVHAFLSKVVELDEHVESLISKVWSSIDKPERQIESNIKFHESKRILFGCSYLLEPIKDGCFLVNNGSLGISIINDKLAVIQNIFLFDLVDYVYKNSSLDKLLLYDSDNLKLVYVNIETGKHFTLKLGPLYEDIYFSPVYYWSRDTVIFASKKQFYCLDIEKKEINTIDSDLAAQHYPGFYNFYLSTLPYDLLTVSSVECQFTFKNRSEKTIGWFDFLSKKTVIAPFYDEEVHDAFYQDGVWLLDSEKKLYVVLKNGKIGTIFPSDQYDFGRARLVLKNNQLRVVAIATPYNAMNPGMVFEYTMSD